jgi:hypothetical protein
LAKALEAAGIPILGTSPDAIDLAEDRERFAALISKLKLKQPENGVARSPDEAVALAAALGEVGPTGAAAAACEMLAFGLGATTAIPALKPDTPAGREHCPLRPGFSHACHHRNAPQWSAG